MNERTGTLLLTPIHVSILEIDAETQCMVLRTLLPFNLSHRALLS